jgi:hypothetical protein
MKSSRGKETYDKEMMYDDDDNKKQHFISYSPFTYEFISAIYCIYSSIIRLLKLLTINISTLYLQ